jgi:hypothetical protein
MTSLTSQGGKLVVHGNALGTGQGCCCDEDDDKLPNCCEEENILLQITFELTGLQDDEFSGCECLNGTYVADVVDVVEVIGGPPVLGTGIGVKIFFPEGCSAQDSNNNTLQGQVYLEWQCNGTAGDADWGFRVPPTPGQYVLTDQMRTGFRDGVACVGGEGDDPEFVGAFVDYKNPFFFGCDTTGVYAKVTIQ